MQISHNYKYIPSLPRLPHYPRPIPPGHHRAADWAPHVLLRNLPERDSSSREERAQPSVLHLTVNNWSYPLHSSHPLPAALSASPLSTSTSPFLPWSWMHFVFDSFQSFGLGVRVWFQSLHPPWQPFLLANLYLFLSPFVSYVLKSEEEKAGILKHLYSLQMLLAVNQEQRHCHRWVKSRFLFMHGFLSEICIWLVNSRGIFRTFVIPC